MTKLLSFDPGLRYPACALFAEGVLVGASRVPIPKGITTRTPILERCRAIAVAVKAFAGEEAVGVLVSEYPQVYVTQRSKGDPNNLIPLAAMGGCLAAIFPGAKVLSPKPREWTGNLPKAEKGDPWDSPRGRRIWGRLTPAERATVVPSHDAVDAVGLGLFGLGRFDRRRVYDAE